jgi:hypothetical protein
MSIHVNEAARQYGNLAEPCSQEDAFREVRQQLLKCVQDMQWGQGNC